VRGGAFNNNDRNVRGAVRNRNNNWNRNIGFRLAVLTFFLHRNCLAFRFGGIPGRGEKWRSLFRAARQPQIGPGE
jgi:hypothetical protein